MDIKRQKIQLEMAFMAESRGEAPMTVGKGTDVPMANQSRYSFRHSVSEYSL